MQPGTTDDVADCIWCGSRSHVERRLRTVEPRATGGFEPARAGGADWSSRGSAPAACPGCASPLHSTLTEEIIECAHCGSFSKLERRLEAGGVGPSTEYPAPVYRWGWLRKRAERRDAERDDTLRRVLEADDPDGRVELVRELTPWEALSSEREELLTELLRIAPFSPMLDQAVVGLVHRFLQKGDVASVGFERHPWRYFVLRCVARVAFRPEASGRLLQELRYARGGGAALKLLLDVGAYAFDTAQLDYAADALAAVEATLTSRSNWKHVDLMSDVVAYRLLYMDERLVAHVLKGMSWSWTLKPRVVARLVDDCAFERPRLVNTLANSAVSLPCARYSDYAEHLEFVETLFTPVARGLALETYVYTPGAGATTLPPEEVESVLAFLDRARGVPESEHAATRVLRWWVDRLAEGTPELLPERVQGLRGSLPENPTWPVPERPTDYDDHLEAIVLRFDDDIEPRSRSDDQDPLPVDAAAVQRRRALMTQLRDAEVERRRINMEQERKGR